MNILKIYTWFCGTKIDFTQRFSHDEALYNMASSFWRELESGSLWFFLLFIIVGAVCAYLYYGPYNNAPGRRYTPVHWLGWLVACGIITFITTLGCAYIAATPTMHSSFNVELKISLCNALYAIGIYFITSFVICRTSFKTNAYRLF